jgi:deoxyribodipyrimidine photolyase-related protein
VRNLVLVLGDQLDDELSAFDGFDPAHDRVLMVEAEEEARYLPQHRQRLVMFFAAMRHFRDALRARGRTVEYSQLTAAENAGSLQATLTQVARRLSPRRLVLTQPGDHRVLTALGRASQTLSLPLELRDDRHFFTTPARFREHAEGRKQLLMETFYRGMRREHGILMHGREPLQGRWNFDADNRERLPATVAAALPRPPRFVADAVTAEVIAMVEREFPDAPGTLRDFNHPVTAEQARTALDDFIAHRLPGFGRYQDAMLAGQRTLYHSLLSSALNLHLLDPRDAIDAAVQAHERGDAPLNAVEGFVRQILGWREYIRGVYWWQMPDYAGLNALDATLPMPSFMWTGDTDMACVTDAVQGLVEHAYTHHIQRLMVLGLFAMLLGVDPRRVHDWHMSMYIDAVDWVSLPNVLGMSQYADGGIVGSKPYCASGNYINRMSNHCAGCRYDPRKAVGEDACPFTTLYWDFLDRNRERLAGNHRMGFQLKNLARKSVAEIGEIRRHAARTAQDLAG